jgi:hypothetical protein
MTWPPALEWITSDTDNGTEHADERHGAAADEDATIVRGVIAAGHRDRSRWASVSRLARSAGDSTLP